MTSDPYPSQQKLWILVPPKDLQAAKDALVKRGILDEDEPVVHNPRIVRQEFDVISQPGELQHTNDCEHSERTPHVAVPTTLQSRGDHSRTQEAASPPRDSILELLDSGTFSRIFLATRKSDLETDRSPKKKPSLTQGNELARAIQHWLRSLPPSISAALPSETQLLESNTWRFTKYAPLLILPSGTISHEPWPCVFATLSPSQIQDFYRHIANRLGITHIAEQGPIPTHTSSDNHSEENVLRSPLGLRPLYGDFGPLAAEPTETAFAASLWVSVKQHGIAQVFAPLYTMFANGNVNEKRRVRDIAEHDLRTSGLKRAAAADLYAGIGYFAFSYAKAGYRPVLCWELNGWSIEGLRRGAETNGWTCMIIKESEELTGEKIKSALGCTFVVFHESNSRASTGLERLRSHLPPIRHVNCGYLPSSQPSWSTALELLDRDHGGWVHVHENCAVKDIESNHRKEAISSSLMSLEDQIGARQISIEHVERVKSYAPGVLHCVFDVLVDPKLEGA